MIDEDLATMLLHQAADEIEVPPGGPDLLDLGWRAAERRLRIDVILAAAAAVVVGLGVIAVVGRPADAGPAGGGTVTVPDVTGLSRDDALARLRKAGFKAAVVYDNDVCRRPEITYTVPHHGERAPRGGGVNLHVVGIPSDGCDLAELGAMALRRAASGFDSTFDFSAEVDYFVDGLLVRTIPRRDVMEASSWDGPDGVNAFRALDESPFIWPQQGAKPTTCTGAKAALPSGVTETPAVVTVVTIWDAGDQMRVPDCGEWFAIDSWVDDEGRLNRVNYRTR